MKTLRNKKKFIIGDGNSGLKLLKEIKDLEDVLYPSKTKWLIQ